MTEVLYNEPYANTKFRDGYLKALEDVEKWAIKYRATDFGIELLNNISQLRDDVK